MSFVAGGDTWSLACDGDVLMVRGSAHVARTGAKHPMNSLIPVQAISELRLSRAANASANLYMRIWDGNEIGFGVPHGDSPEIIAGLLALRTLVAQVNASWPLSGARALAARRSISPGYLRDKYMLGLQGLEEFWSPLADLPWEWANRWRESGYADVWPIAAAEATSDGAPALLGFLADYLVILRPDKDATDIPYANLDPPVIAAGESPQPLHESLEAQTPLHIGIRAHGGPTIEVSTQVTEALQPLFRFLLFRWAESNVAASGTPIEALQQASADLSTGALSPQAFAAIVDATIATESGAALSLSFPPRERDYLRPVEKVVPATPHPTPPVAGGPTPPRSSGPTARQVAAGAAAGAAIWSLFAD